MHYKWKLHSKIKIIDLVGFFLEFKGESSRRNLTVKQTAENGQKISVDDDAVDITSLAAGVKNSRLRNDLNSTRCDRLTTAGHVHELFTADDGHFESLTWPWMKARWLHWCQNARLCQFFSLSVWPSSSLNFDLGPSSSDSTAKKKKTIRSKAYDFGL